nr:hypothetical protein CFP56_39087 [Quercus suber]
MGGVIWRWKDPISSARFIVGGCEGPVSTWLKDEDLLIWPRTPDGLYSVKSASQLLANKHKQAQAGSSDVEAGKCLWNEFGSLSIWTRCNKLRVKQQVWDVGDTVKKAKELLQEFQDVQRPSTRLVVPREVV